MQTDIPFMDCTNGDADDAKYWVNNNGQIFYEARDEYDITTIQHYLCGYDTKEEAYQRVLRQTFYVNVYERGRAYGGPEEGGWWYNVFTAKSSIQADGWEEAQGFLAILKEKFPAPTNWRDDEYFVCLQQHYAKDYNDYAPWE